MGRDKTEIKKVESAASRHVAFCKRRANLFKKAHELAVLCDAEVGVIILCSDGKVFEFASSSMERILTRLKKCLETRNAPSIRLEPEEAEEQVTEEVDALTQEAQEPKLQQWKWLSKDLTGMGLEELRELENRLNEGMLYIKDRKMQLVMEELEQSRMQEQQALLKNQSLQRQVEELQGFLPSISYPLPFSVQFPVMGGNFRPTDNRFLPSTSSAMPFAIDYNPETERRVRPADQTDQNFFPYTTLAAPLASDNGTKMGCNVEPADEDADTTLALAPTWGWFKK